MKETMPASKARSPYAYAQQYDNKSGRRAMEQRCSGGAPCAFNCVTMCGPGEYWATHACMHAPGRSRFHFRHAVLTISDTIWQWRPLVDDGRSPTLNCASFFDSSLWSDIVDKIHVPQVGFWSFSLLQEREGEKQGVRRSAAISQAPPLFGHRIGAGEEGELGNRCADIYSLGSYLSRHV